MALRPVVAFDVGVSVAAPRLDMLDHDAAILQHIAAVAADVFGFIFQRDCSERIPKPCNDAVDLQRLYYSSAYREIRNINNLTYAMTSVMDKVA